MNAPERRRGSARPLKSGTNYIAPKRVAMLFHRGGIWHAMVKELEANHRQQTLRCVGGLDPRRRFGCASDSGCL